MHESLLYHTLKEKAPSTKFWRIENTLNLGTPDMTLTNQQGSAFLEAKQRTLTESINGCVHIPFRPGQYAWLRDYHKYGGTSLLGIVTEYGFFFARNTAIKEAYTREEMHSARLDEYHPALHRQNKDALYFVSKVYLNDFMLYIVTK